MGRSGGGRSQPALPQGPGPSPPQPPRPGPAEARAEEGRANRGGGRVGSLSRSCHRPKFNRRRDNPLLRDVGVGTHRSDVSGRIRRPQKPKELLFREPCSLHLAPSRCTAKPTQRPVPESQGRPPRPRGAARCLRAPLPASAGGLGFIGPAIAFAWQPRAAPPPRSTTPPDPQAARHCASRFPSPPGG